MAASRVTVAARAHVPTAVVAAGACRNSVSASFSATTGTAGGPVPPYWLGKRNGRNGAVTVEARAVVAATAVLALSGSAV